VGRAVVYGGDGLDQEGPGVTERPSQPAVDRGWSTHEVGIDIAVAPPTRVADYVDGGDAHFAVDRDVAEQLFGSVPGGVERFRAVFRASQAFLERVVHHLTAEVGIRQFLVTGWKLSGEPNVHDMAQAVAPASRVVYLALDPVLLAHAHVLRSSTPEGATAYVHAKLRDPDEILRRAAATLDLAEPVAVLLPATLGFVRKDETAYRIVAQLMDGLASGSHLALSHHASDLFVDEHVEMFRSIERLAAEGKTWGVTPRSHAEVAKFFDGLELLEPGLVPQDEWGVPGGAPADGLRGAMYGAVGRKP
jgi:hypothetical protein